MSASDFNDDWNKRFNLSWQHYDPWGHATLNLYGDTRSSGLSFVGLSHYFYSVDGGVHFSSQKQGEKWQERYGVYKFFSERTYEIRYTYFEQTSDHLIATTVRYPRLFFDVAYSTQHENYSFGTRYKVNDAVWIHASGSGGESDWRGEAGIQVRFTTGKPYRRVRRKEQKKPIEWQ